MAGYAFAKLKFWGREVLFWALMSVIMIPGFITIIPLYQLIRAFKLIDTIWAVILPGLTGGIGAMFLMRQVMRTLPTEIIESGRIDGSGEFRIFWELIMPLAKPGLAVLGIFHFVGNWNSFLWPLIVLRAKEKFLLASGLGLLASPKDTGMGSMTGVLFVGQVMAGACIQAIPIIIVFLLFQQYFLKGITIGAIKG
jgi:multiple sugar transport system permease protein